MQTDLPAEPRPVLVPVSRAERILFALVVTVLPLVAFGSTGIAKPDWQSNAISDYVTLVMLPEASLLFFPLLLYSVAAYILLLVNQERFARVFAARLGVYTGALLALQYFILAGIYFPLSLILGPVVIGFYSLMKRIQRRRGWRVIAGISVVLVIVGVVILNINYPENSLLGVLGEFTQFGSMLLILLLVASPGLALWIGGLTAIRLFRQYEDPLPVSTRRIVALTGWVLGYQAAITYAIVKMFALYDSLPKTPPNCYIASAAAHGHPRLVRSRPVSTRSGGVLPVNPQLQTLKCAELALMALAPRLHRPLRAAYDRAGRPLARRLGHPLLADLAYLSLLPLELAARLALNLLAPGWEAFASRIYH